MNEPACGRCDGTGEVELSEEAPMVPCPQCRGGRCHDCGKAAGVVFDGFPVCAPCLAGWYRNARAEWSAKWKRLRQRYERTEE